MKKFNFARGKKGKDGGGKGGNAFVRGEGVAIGGRGGTGGMGRAEIILPNDWFVKTDETRKGELEKLRKQNEALMTDANNLATALKDALEANWYPLDIPAVFTNELNQHENLIKKISDKTT